MHHAQVDILVFISLEEIQRIDVIQYLLEEHSMDLT